MRVQSYSGAESSPYSSSSSYSVSTLLTKPCTFELRMLYYNKLLLHKIDKIKMAGTSREISSVMTGAANNYNTRLDLSVRIKTRIRTEVKRPGRVQKAKVNKKKPDRGIYTSNVVISLPTLTIFLHILMYFHVYPVQRMALGVETNF